MDLSDEFVNKKLKKNESDSYQAGSIVRENACTSAAAEEDNSNIFVDSSKYFIMSNLNLFTINYQFNVFNITLYLLVQEEVAIIADNKENEETETVETIIQSKKNCGKKNFSERKILSECL